MPHSNEPDHFCMRLRQGLQDIGFPSDNPVGLAREFNRRHRGAPITVHTTRKWLLGQAVPTQDKLRSIAEWLDVSPEWLGFGESNAARQPTSGRANPATAARVNLAMIADLHRLDEAHRQMVRDFVRTLLKLQVAQARDRTM